MNRLQYCTGVVPQSSSKGQCGERCSERVASDLRVRWYRFFGQRAKVCSAGPGEGTEDGEEAQVLDLHGMTSPFIWHDAEHVLAGSGTLHTGRSSISTATASKKRK